MSIGLTSWLLAAAWSRGVARSVVMTAIGLVAAAVFAADVGAVVNGDAVAVARE